MSLAPNAVDRRRDLLDSKLFRYAVIGGVASAIDVGLFVLLHDLSGMPALGAHSISIPVAALYSFVCNAFLNFGTTDRLWLRGVAFGIVVGLGYLLGAAIIWAVESLTPLGGTSGKLLSLPFVFLFQFVLNSRISFRGATA